MSRRSKAQLERDRRRISDLYLQGWLQVDIADEVGVNQSTVSRDLTILQEEWRAASIMAIDAKKGEELAKVDRLEREYWQAWERSCEDAETLQQKVKADGTKEATKTAKGQAGDPRFLTGVQWCINKRCEILGIDAPQRHEHTGKDGQPIETKSVNDEDYTRTISALAQALDALGDGLSGSGDQADGAMGASE